MTVYNYAEFEPLDRIMGTLYTGSSTSSTKKAAELYVSTSAKDTKGLVASAADHDATQKSS
jgi:hypothetical protein